MRRGRTPLVFKIIIDHIITMYPKRQASTIERMLRAREITFNKGELRKIILFLHEAYQGLAPKKKKELPDELSALRKIFLNLVDKSETEPHLMVNVYAAKLAESGERMGSEGIDRDDGSDEFGNEGTGGNKIKSKPIMMRKPKAAATMKPRKRKLKEVAATDSEEDASSSSERSGMVIEDSGMSNGYIADGNWAKSTYWSGNEHPTNDNPSDVNMNILSASPNAFTLFSNSPGLGLVNVGSRVGMPPPLSIPPSAMQQEQQIKLTSSPNSNESSTTDESLEADDNDFELLKTLLVDSPHQSHYAIIEDDGVVSNTSTNNNLKETEVEQEDSDKATLKYQNESEMTSDNNSVSSGTIIGGRAANFAVSEVDKKVTLCYRAKRVLDSWEGWQDLELFINSHKEEFKFLKDFEKETIKNYIQEFKRFLTLKAINEDVHDTTIAASLFIDKLWLALIQKPSAYQSLCDALLPASKVRVMDRDPDNKPTGLVDSIFTVNEYSHVYGVPPSAEFWDSSFVATTDNINTDSDKVDPVMTYKEVRFKACLANDMVFSDILASKSLSGLLQEYRRERGLGEEHVKDLVLVYDGTRLNVSESDHANVTLGQLLGASLIEDHKFIVNVFVV